MPRNFRKLKIGVECEDTQLTPIRYDKIVNGKAYYIFKCRCGKEKSILASNVTNNNPRGKTKSCGHLQKIRHKEFGEIHRFDRKGVAPWNKGKRGYSTACKGKPSWRRGCVKFTYPNGSHAWVKVSDEPIGSNHPWYVKPTRSTPDNT